MAAMYPMSPDAVREALMGARGNLSKAAERLGCTRQTIYNCIKAHPELEEVRVEARQCALDRVEDKAWDAAEEGEPWAVTFILKTQAKDRGYTERQEVSGKDGGSINVAHALQGAEGLSTEEAVALYQRIIKGGSGQP